MNGSNSIRKGLETLRRRWPEAVSRSEESPVFVLAAGWRSGSTLLQRLLASGCFMWGEPYGHSWMIDSLAQPLRCFTDSWPEPHFIYQGQDAQQRATTFVANLFPKPHELMQAHLAYFDALFASPARRAGATRWGLKEVRLSADHAAYLRWLYPRAKLLFVCRNPYDAYRSYAARRNAGWKWFNRWPDKPLTVAEFARHWRVLTASFLEHYQELGALFLRYEDLARGEYEQVEQYLEMPLTLEAAATRPADGPPPLEIIPDAEAAVLDAECKELAAALGYQHRRAPDPPAPVVRPAQAASNARCVVLVPVGGHIEAACERSLQKLEERGYRVRRIRGYSAIDQGRNQMATDALANGFEETLWIDSDIDFDPDAVDRLRSHQLPICCALYPKKGKRELACHVMPGTEKIVFGRKGGLVEVLYAGAGFLHIRREAYSEIQRRLELPSCNDRWGNPMIPFFQPMIKPHVDGYWYLAEDFSFCERARQAGFRIMADTTIRLRHIGSYGYSWEDAGIEPERYGTFHFHLSGAAKNLDKLAARTRPGNQPPTRGKSPGPGPEGEKQ